MLRAGISISLTGRFARQGRQALQAIELWAESARAELLFRDDESRAARAVENCRSLLEGDHVDILFGPYSSGLALAAATVAKERGAILWNHGGASDDVAGPHVVSTLSPASEYFRRLPRWLRKNAPDLATITIISSRSGTFAGHIARGLAKEAELAGYKLELLPMTEAFPQKVDVLVLAGSFEEEIRILRCCPPARIVAAVAAGINAFSQELGPHANQVIGPSQWEPGPESERFVTRFQQRFGQPPDYIAAGAFATGLIVEECIRRTGSLDGSRLRQAATELDLQTFYGRFRIDCETGRQTGHEVLLVRWQNGRKVRC